jgi:Cu/Ag efflux protein CusF
MKMGFAVTDKAAVAKLKPGDHVEFTVRKEPNKDGDYVIDSISPVSSK